MAEISMRGIKGERNFNLERHKEIRRENTSLNTLELPLQVSSFCCKTKTRISPSKRL